MSYMSVNGNYKNSYAYNAALNSQRSQQNRTVRQNPEAKHRDCIHFAGGGIDSEEKAIMDRLYMYGCIPTGDKATDRAKLRRIEYEHAKQDNYVSNKYLTVSAGECERIQERKKEKRKIANPEKLPKKQDERLSDKLKGEQVYLAIKMKKRDK